MKRNYAPGSIRRWEPHPELPELPLSAFDLSWSANRTLVCSGYYGHNSTPEYGGVIIEFEDVHAFASFDGFSDTLLSYQEHPLPLKGPVPYGGNWPFVEVVGSHWAQDIIDEHGGMPHTHDFTHWCILTFDQTLHVMAHRKPEPVFKGWIRPTS